MNTVAGDDQTRKELRPKAGLIHVVVELAELLLGVGTMAEGLDDGEAAVRLLDVGVEPPGVGPLRDEQALRTPRDHPRRP